jgi:parallel beta-helix repeat protein
LTKLANGLSGLVVDGSDNNVFANCIFSGNGVNGVTVSGAKGNTLTNNMIGVGKDGSTKIANTKDGVALVNGSSNTTVGGTAAGGPNVISYNLGNGVSILTQGNCVTNPLNYPGGC